MMAPAQTQTRTRKATESSSHAPIAPQRPVRFVTNNDEPLSKRRRISAACRTCQRRKTKCSGERPDCSTCLESDTVCLGYAQHNHGGNKAARLSSKRNSRDRGGVSSRPAQNSSRSHDPDHLMDKISFQHSPPSSAIQSSDSDGVPSPANGPSPKNGSHSALPSALNDHFDYPVHYRARVPYFRYFGPTAMVPGFKQMVVDLNHHPELEPIDGAFTSHDDSKTAPNGSDAPQHRKFSPTSPAIPFYSRSDRAPVPPLIKELCEDFFTHLGSNYPFLTHANFMRDLERKQLDTILVDAVCAIAARFSQNPELAAAGQTVRCDDNCADRTHRSKYGCVFARRAMSAITDFFACPTLAAVQACLLLAYEQFGADHDSGLWIYLGLSIRMAQDLGIQKLEGLQYEGYLGPTPRTVKSGAAGKAEEQRRADKYHAMLAQRVVDPEKCEEQRMAEKERINTFWAIFFLDRVVSSGTGRPVTLRDKDIEISFPQDEIHGNNEWPAPFPALIRIVHSYGRVANLLNNIREANQLTPEIMKQLVAAEDDLIGIYQRLSPKLHFSAGNFQHYLKQSQATNFILLHFWFHTLIVLLHQPTLLHSFEGRIQQLFPNSQELSLSSAKTIADILSFAELLDSKSFIGNPFTSQPMYFAACAFLLESASHSVSRPNSRLGTPPLTPYPSTPGAVLAPNLQSHISSAAFEPFPRIQRPENKQAHAKKSLLAAAASQNYQRCYKALKALETYWAGTRYIVTVLDQKAKGSLDPLLYTAEYLGASELPAAKSLYPFEASQPKLIKEEDPISLKNDDRNGHLAKLKSAVGPHFGTLGSGKGAEASQPIGWSLTGSSDSAGSNLSVLYQIARDAMAPPSMPMHHKSSSLPEFSSLSQLGSGGGSIANNKSTNSQEVANTGLRAHAPVYDSNSISTTSAPNLNHLSPLSATTTLGSTVSGYDASGSRYFSTSSPQTMSVQPQGPDLSGLQVSQPAVSESTLQPTTNSMILNSSPQDGLDPIMSMDAQAYALGSHANNNLNDMIIESQDIDTSVLRLDPLLWLDFTPQDTPHAFELQSGLSPATENLKQ